MKEGEARGVYHVERPVIALKMKQPQRQYSESTSN